MPALTSDRLAIRRECAHPPGEFGHGVQLAVEVIDSQAALFAVFAVIVVLC